MKFITFLKVTAVERFGHLHSSHPQSSRLPEHPMHPNPCCTCHTIPSALTPQSPFSNLPRFYLLLKLSSNSTSFQNLLGFPSKENQLWSHMDLAQVFTLS